MTTPSVARVPDKAVKIWLASLTLPSNYAPPPTCLTRFVLVVKVNFSGAVRGKAVWPSSYQPVAWHNDADKVMFKLGLYHIKNKVGSCCYCEDSRRGPLRPT